ncbi:murein transglycosylase domain-containing protein [Balneolales bacterium ANBcel1]|nr:murein transglycosylase domain-containing protein [Balneolales bacterium ANBcel1]
MKLLKSAIIPDAMNKGDAVPSNARPRACNPFAAKGTAAATAMILMISGFLFSPPQLVAQQTFEEFQAQQREAFEEFSDLEREGMILDEVAFEEYRAEQQALFEAFREEMERRWGDFRERTKTNWVEYRSGGTVRWDVDFEEGSVEVEVLAEEGDTEEILREKIRESVVDLAESRGTRSEMPEDDEEIYEEPVLEGQLDLGDADDIAGLAQRAAEEAQLESRNSEEVRQILRVNLSLVPDHIRTRAEKFQKYLAENTGRYEQDPALILAIIHTESYFNPVARSHANALGLMQIVPNTAGRDVYRRLRNKDGIPSPDLLFDPNNNLLFGCTYYDILTNQYIRGVTSPRVLEYMAISAYNTGAGNVARAYTGNTNINRAVTIANEMSPEENYNHLIENLPWEETRDYLQKVTERRASYREWLSAE